MSKYHEPTTYQIRVEQRNMSLSYDQLRDYVERVFSRVTKEFQLLSKPSDSTHQPPPQSPPPNVYVWCAFVHQHGHAPKFAKTVRNISKGDPIFLAEAQRSPSGC
jgi:hypothetical protein